MALISNPDNPISPQGVLALATTFTFILWLLAGIRFWVLRHYSHERFSPRWISDCSVWLIVGFTTMSLGLLFFAYHLVLELRTVEDKLDYLDTVYHLDTESRKFKRETFHYRRGSGKFNPEKAYEDLTIAYDHILLMTMKSSLAWRLLCTTALWLVKFSIVMVYVELLDSLTKPLRWMIYASLATIIGSFVAIVTLFCYGMPSENWGEQKQSSLPIVTEYFYGGSNILTDLQVLIVALWALYVVRLPHSRIYAVTFLLFMGFVTISLAAARALMYDDHIRSGTPLRQSVDIIGMIEPLVASWLACLPALRVLFKMRKKSQSEEDDISLSCRQDDPIQIRSQTSSHNCDRESGVGLGRFESLDNYARGITIDECQNQEPIPEKLPPHIVSTMVQQASWPLPDKSSDNLHSQPERRAFSVISIRSYTEVADVVDAYGEADSTDEEGPPIPEITTNHTNAAGKNEKEHEMNVQNREQYEKEREV